MAKGKRFDMHRKSLAADLPEKVSTVLYSEMGVEQRKVYDAYEKEFRDFTQPSMVSSNATCRPVSWA